ncbi:MAG: FmdE family protein [Thermodesulfovibrionales bacterium]|nr:FmdE family protein [Thermodesulfovibrionales bacterium]
MKKLDEIVKFHGHICPRLVLGYRVSAFALKNLGKVKKLRYICDVKE